MHAGTRSTRVRGGLRCAPPSAYAQGRRASSAPADLLSKDVEWLAVHDPDMAKMLQGHIAQYRLLREGRAGQISKAEFAKLDADGDGRITREEFSRHGDMVFSEIDRNNDGVLTPKEFEAFRRRTATTWMNAIPRCRDAVAITAADGPATPDAAAPEAPVERPTLRQYTTLALALGVPMLGFGFVDNFLMISCGEAIETTLGAYMSLSTLAAAGLGNMCSDVAGLGISGFIENSARTLGLESPALTARQLQLRSVRAVSFGATLVGVCIGCLLGMVPLLLSSDASKPRLSAEPKAVSGKTGAV